MPNRKTRSIQLVRPHVAGKPLISLKKRPNDPCQCGSGKKQKKCHGMNTVFWSPKPEVIAKKTEEVPLPEVVPAAPVYLYLSLKHTHKKDKWLTFWRDNSAGYTFIMEWVGNYADVVAWDDATAVPYDIAENYMTEVEYEGVKRMVIPNTAPVRKAFGITLNDLKELRPYKF